MSSLVAVTKSPGSKDAAAVVYTCPGEAHPISRAVHYARMAAYYPGCRHCTHRHDVGHLPPAGTGKLEIGSQGGGGASLISEDGIRGVYLNEMTRGVAARFAAAFAVALWEQAPLRLRDPANGPASSGRRRLTVVVGQDERAAAPDLAVGVAEAVRRMGCDVVDVGVVSASCFACAVEHLESSGGIYVTGHGGGSGRIGLDLFEAGGIPWSQGGSLDRVADALTVEPRRTSRRGGSQRSFRIRVPYEAGLLKHFQTISALRIGLMCLAPTVTPLLAGLFASMPSRLESVEAPVANDPDRALSLAVSRLAERVRDDRLHAGFLISDDGQRCRLLDERGAAVETEALAVRMCELALHESRSRIVVLDEALGPDVFRRLRSRDWTVVTSGGSREAMTRSMRQSGAAFGCDAAGRWWFGDSSPACDAVTTLGRVLQLLSRSEGPASALRDAG